MVGLELRWALEKIEDLTRLVSGLDSAQHSIDYVHG